MKVIELPKGLVTIVDDADFMELAQYRWHCSNGYVIRNSELNCKDKRTTIYMHVEIFKPEKGFQVDHKNRNPLDNRRCNLRQATISQNKYNSKKYKNNTSGFKGVSFNQPTGKWIAAISVRGKQMHLGLFKTAEEASVMRNKAARILHGPFAALS